VKTTYRMFVRRRVEAALRVHLKTPSRAIRQAGLDDPADFPDNVISVATQELAPRRRKGRKH